MTAAVPPALHLLLAAGIAGPLVYAAMAKLLEPARFADAIPRFGLTFLTGSRRNARFIGLLELLISGALVVLPIAATAANAGVLFLVLAAVIAHAQSTGSSGECGCFGALPAAIDGRAVVRNVTLAAAGLALAWARSADMVAPYEPPAAALALAALTLGSAAVDTVLEVRRNAA